MHNRATPRHFHRRTLVLALALAVSSGVHAQSNTTGNIAGQATPGSAVTVNHLETGFSRTIPVGADGSYRAGALPPGNYVVELLREDGITPAVRKKVEVAVGNTTSVSLGVNESWAVEAPTDLERIVVTATYLPPIDPTSVESSTILSEAIIERLPVPRNVTSVALMAPGTVRGDSMFGDLASFGGASVGENTYYINGFNVTNFRTGLGFSRVPFDMYSQYQVKTGGYGAEFGRSTGGVINATTKSGGNEWHFGTSMYWTPDRWRRNDPVVRDANGVVFKDSSQDSFDELEVSQYVSGPLVEDRLFMYAIGSVRDTSQSTVTPDGAVDFGADDPFFGIKIDARLSDDHRLEYTGFRDRSDHVMTGTRTQYPAPGQPAGYTGPVSQVARSGGENHILKYTGYLSDSFTLSALVGRGEYSLSSYNAGASADDCLWFVAQPALGAPRSLGCALRSTDDFGDDRRDAYRLDAEWDVGEVFLGSHFLRFGMDHEQNRSVNDSTTPGPTGYRYSAFEAPGMGWMVQRDLYLNQGAVETETRAFYLEDQWQVADNVLLSLGVRNEQFDNRNAEGQTFIDLDDQWAPRVGFAWDIGGQSTRKLFANYGRYHLPVANNTNLRLAGSETFISDYYLWDGATLDGDGAPVMLMPLGGVVYADGTVTPPASSVDSGIEPMYQDEFILGYQWEFMPKWSIGVRGIYRDLGSTIEDVSVDAALMQYALANGHDGYVPTGTHYVLTNPGSDVDIQVDLDGDGQLDPVHLTAASIGVPESERTYKAVELFWERAWDGEWFLQGSYTYSRSEGNNEGWVRSDTGQRDAGFTSAFDLAWLMDGAYGRLPNDRPHVFKLWGGWQVAPEFMVSANLLHQSGRPVNCFGSHPTAPDAAGYPGEAFYCGGEFAPRGSRGRTGSVTQLDLGLEYRPQWGNGKLAFRADITNALGDQTAVEVWETGEYPNVPVADSMYGVGTAFQAPRAVRLGFSFDW